MTLSLPAETATSPELTSTDYALYGATVFAWGFSWIAIKGQMGSIAPEVSVFWRFVLASMVMFAWCGVKNLPLRFSAASHLRFAGLGALIFSTNFTLFYYGAQMLPSGLLSVVFSLASILNLVLAFLIFAQRPSRQSLIAGVLGFSGIALMFAPQIMAVDTGLDAAIGLGLCALGTLSFCLGNMLSASNQRQGLPVMSASAWGMMYGALFLGLFSLIRGNEFSVEWTLTYFASLLYLAIIASVVAFGSYLTLLGRIGSDRAGYATVIFPVVALTVSTFFEGYSWTPEALAGLLLVLTGNILMLRRKQRR